MSKSHYTARELAVIALHVGVPRTQLATAVAIALAESGGNAHARCYNYRTPSGRVTCGRRGTWTISTDRCLFQVNDRAHPWSTRGDIDDPLTCARAALRVSHGGRNWRPWSTYLSGSYRRHLAAARAAVAQVIRTN